jgi:hypothetical protein
MRRQSNVEREWIGARLNVLAEPDNLYYMCLNLTIGLSSNHELSTSN